MEKKECDNGELAIGIDLGTTYSCVAVWKEDDYKIETLADDYGKKTIASCVAFHGNERLVGNIAKKLYYRNPANTIFDVKRLIGREYSDSNVKSNSVSWPFKVIEGEDRKAMVSVTYKGEEKRYSPKEISAMVLMRLREIVEKYVKSSVKNAVIAVPVYFNDAQRQATRDAAVLAGLNVMRIISEPSAVAIAHGHKKGLWNGNRNRNILVFDLGGGTLDVTLITIVEGRFDVKSTAGDPNLGGEDFVKRLVDHYTKEIKKKLNKDIHGDPKAASEIRRACEKVKKNLSLANSFPFRVQAVQDIDFTDTTKRSLFEEINKDLFRKCLHYVQICLEDGGMHKNKVDEVVLAGGSTRIPKIQELLVEFFDRPELICKSSEPEQMVAHGTAIYAGILSGKNVKFFRSLSDTNPLSIGLETDEGKMTVLIPRNTKIPTKKSRAVYLREAANEAGRFRDCKLRVYEGESEKTAENNFLGGFTLSNIPNIVGLEIEVSFEMNVDGILTVSAMEKSSGKKNEIIISNDTQRRRISMEEVKKMFLEAESFKIEADKYKKMEKILDVYSSNIYETLRRDCKIIMNHSDPKDELMKIQDSIQQVQEWMQSNKPNVDEEEFEKKITWLHENISLPIVKKLLVLPIEEEHVSNNFSIREIKIKSHQHSLNLESAMSFHKCNSCKTVILKSEACYSCKKKKCNLHLHKECALAPPSATHQCLRDCEELRYHENKPEKNELFCEACGKRVEGSYYQCGQHETGHALHPRCLKLDRTVVVGKDMMLHLTNKILSEEESCCMKCNKKQVREGFVGWSFTTTDGKYCYHVACVMDMIKKISENLEEEEEEEEEVETGKGKGKRKFKKQLIRALSFCGILALQVLRFIISLYWGVDIDIQKMIDFSLTTSERLQHLFPDF